jgi:hypothetical protein
MFDEISALQIWKNLFISPHPLAKCNPVICYSLRDSCHPFRFIPQKLQVITTPHTSPTPRRFIPLLEKATSQQKVKMLYFLFETGILS